mmetsp:Transcript_17650/g.35269  ORF Transcript_17650/g.35269 Transcript_17650/m.35269 type:complete len:364 (-) Transcript_17650:1066-2157(-)
MTLAVGSTVRIRDGGGGKKKNPFTCKAIVATVSGDNTVSLVRDDLAPVPLGRVGKFIVAPLFNSVGINSVGRSVEECESSIDDLMELLPFEDKSGNEIADSLSTAEKVEFYKSRGDQLLRLNDYTCAAAYYEAALSFIANVSIGGTCIARKNGDAVIADVDCIDDDQYDVTFTSQNGEEEETTIPLKDILCSIWCKDEAYLQPRCLLNLSRCLVKLAEIDSTSGNVGCAGQRKRATRQEKYRSSAVLGCSITITLCEHLKESTASPDVALLDSLIGKARVIRSRAFIGRNMLKNAMVDAKKVTTQDPDDKDALKLISEIKAIEARSKLLDKKISREVCRWVKKATTTSEGAAAIERMDEESSI